MDLTTNTEQNTYNHYQELTEASMYKGEEKEKEKEKRKHEDMCTCKKGFGIPCFC